MINEKFDESKNKKLLLMFLLYVIIQGAAIISYGIVNYFDLPWISESVMMALICFVLYRSYRSHTKNVMKPLLGAALALLLYYELDWGMNYIQNFGDILTNYKEILVFVVAQILLFVVVAVFNILHYAINYTHHSSPKLVKINKTMFILFVAFIAVQCVSLLFVDCSVMLTISNLCSTLSDIFVLGIIISIESNLDEYRIAREAKAE